MEGTSQPEQGQGDDQCKADHVLGRKDDAATKSSRENPPPVATSTPFSTVSSSDDSDSDDEPKSGGYAYDTLEEWKDVTPIPLAVGSVMPIAFTADFNTVFGYFRALIATGELSVRGLRVSEDAARLNPANYAVWMYRRKVLTHLQSDLKIELAYISRYIIPVAGRLIDWLGTKLIDWLTGRLIDWLIGYEIHGLIDWLIDWLIYWIHACHFLFFRVIAQNPKNYQVWYHRQKIVELLKDPSAEFEFTAKMLSRDAKNYHVWQYRQFILRHFDILDHTELDFSGKLIETDPFNNSAWMHRHYVLDELPRACGRKSLLEGLVLRNEIEWATISVFYGYNTKVLPLHYCWRIFFLFKDSR